MGDGGNPIYSAYRDVPLITVYVLHFSSRTGYIIGTEAPKQGTNFGWNWYCSQKSVKFFLRKGYTALE